ncbi:MAG: metallophosphoesterase [Sphaerobacter sp.]|nr:metallophosphoesterase [Sphaerobacter sp.]
MIRLAAIADIHARRGTEGVLRGLVEAVARDADLLLIAGDLTDSGLVEEARLLASVLDASPLPVVAVLGNHDFHHQQQLAIQETLAAHGVVLLDGDGWVFERGGVRLGIAGCVGFGGGFRPYSLESFGEPEWKLLYDKVVEESRKLDRGLAAVSDCDYLVAMTHYSPTVDTMGDEPPPLYPFLGSSELGQALERHGVLFAVHGHAHRGRRDGCTDQGIPVFNVALPVVQRPLIWRFDPRRPEAVAQPVAVAPGGPVT